MTDKNQCQVAFLATNSEHCRTDERWMGWQQAWAHLSADLAASRERDAQLARLAAGALQDFGADRHAAVAHALQIIHGTLSQSSAPASEAALPEVTQPRPCWRCGGAGNVEDYPFSKPCDTCCGMGYTMTAAPKEPNHD